MNQAQIDGIVLEYEVRGSGEPVVLIHGSHIADAFSPLMNETALTRRYRLFRYRRRGFPGSPIPKSTPCTRSSAPHWRQNSRPMTNPARRIVTITHDARA